MKAEDGAVRTSAMEDVSDAELARRVQHEDVEAFEELMNRYKERLTRYARRFAGGLDADDIVQETFVKAYRNIRSFNTARPFSPWLYRIAHNEAINFIRRAKREPLAVFDLDVVFPHAAGEEDVAADASSRETGELLKRFVGELPPKYREPIVLYYFEEFSYEAISDIMRIPKGTVAIRLKRAKDLLRTKLRDRL